jgi:hypothetical protein
MGRRISRSKANRLSPEWYGLAEDPMERRKVASISFGQRKFGILRKGR